MRVIYFYVSNSQTMLEIQVLTGTTAWNVFLSVLVEGVQFSCSVVSDSLRAHEPQHARPPCPSPTPGVYPNSCPLSRWYHPTISSCHPLLLLPSIFPSIKVFSNESVLPIRWPKYWSFSFNISPSNEHPGLISFGMDWLDLLAVQGTLKSLTECGPLGKGMANQFNILALRTPWTVWKCKKIGQWKMNSPGRILVVT